ncbi:hypothetical protein A9Q83_15065 [Alphaproteobacteria bacterium 46_93_T64]|nr:hypothetical protein A9Q83_15065 [Alphaproteobacteria bacterium 46_93_T64]
MILTCPSCSTRYSIDSASVSAEGRMVKCAKCGHKWREFPPEDMPKKVAELPQAPDPMPEPEAPQVPEAEGMSIEEMSRASKKRAQKKEKPPKKKRNWLGWLLFILILGGLGAGGFYGRNYVVQFWPASAKLYQMIKLDVKTTNLLGLEIKNLTTKSILENGVVRLTVTGNIVNVTAHQQPIPRIAIQLVDSEGLHVYSWSAAPGVENVEPWGSVEFSSSMNQPPEEAKHVKAHLIAPKKPEQEHMEAPKKAEPKKDEHKEVH